MKNRSIALALAVLLIIPITLAFSSSAEKRYVSVQTGYGTDFYVYAPAYYDLCVATDAEEPKYQWFVGVGRNLPTDELMMLEDTDGWSGTQTAHLRSTTHDGMAYTDDQSGWDALYFCCRVTDKYGNVGWGPDLNMVIHTHDEFLQKLEKEGVGINDVSISVSEGSIRYSREDNGVIYYDVYSPFTMTGLFPIARYSPIPAELRTISDGDVKIEHYVTYDGKTMPYDGSSHGFIPGKYGKNIVSFRSDLVLYVNGERMETLDSATTVVSVNVPDGIGVALTKNECALHEGQWNESKILTRIPKDERVTLLSESGSFYRVAVAGYFGYINKAALDLVDNISSVSIKVQEPTTYKQVDGIVGIDDSGLYTADARWNSEMWYDKTAGKFLSAGDTFYPNHKYSLQVWLTAGQNKRFVLSGGNPKVVGYVNGMKATVKTAYEQDPEEIVEITIDFDHVHDLTKVNRVYPTCTTPGKDLYYYCSGCGWSFEDYEAKVKITDEDWGVLAARGHLQSYWMSNGTEHYKVCMRRDCEEVINGTKGAHTGGTATCLSGPVCTVCGLSYGPKGAHQWQSGWEYKNASGHAHYCKYFCGSHSEVQPHRPGKEATATEPQVCLDCGYVIKNAGSHTHSIEKITAAKATCLESGNKEYYRCSSCEKIFSDAEGKKEITFDAVRIDALGHKASSVWKLDSEAHWHLCDRCGEVIQDTRADHSFEGAEEKCSVCGYIKGGETVATVTDTEAPESGNNGAGTTDQESNDVAEKPGDDTSVPDGKAGNGSSNLAKIILIIVVIVVGAALGSVVAVLIYKQAIKKNGSDKEPGEDANTPPESK